MLVVLIGFGCLFTMTDIYQDGQASARSETLRQAISGTVPYAIILLTSGTLLLRGLRAQLGIAEEQAFNRRQLRDVLIFAVLVTLVFAVDPFVYLKKALSFLLDEVLRPSVRALRQLLASSDPARRLFTRLRLRRRLGRFCHAGHDVFAGRWPGGKRRRR